MITFEQKAEFYKGEINVKLPHEAVDSIVIESLKRLHNGVNIDISLIMKKPFKDLLPFEKEDLNYSITLKDSIGVVLCNYLFHDDYGKWLDEDKERQEAIVRYMAG